MPLPIFDALRRGTRGKADAATSPATAAPLIVGLGDSITWGSGTSKPPSTSYVNQAASMLGAQAVNLGLPAAFTERVAMEIPRVASDCATVVVNTGTNNAGVAAGGASAETAVDKVRNDMPSARALFADLKLYLPRTRLIVVTVRDLGRGGAYYPNASNDALTAAAREWNVYLRQLAAQAGATLLDLETADEWYIRSEYDDTGIHPTNGGSARLARALATLIDPVAAHG